MCKAVRSWLVEIIAAVAIAAGTIVGVFGASFVAFAQIEAPAASAPRLPIPIRLIEVKDGDTIAADILLPWDVTLREQSIRECSFDAWESSKRRHSAAVGGEVTDAEVAKGKLASAALKALLESGEVYAEPKHGTARRGERDVYGRILAKLWVKRSEGWVNVAAEMSRLGHARKPP